MRDMVLVLNFDDGSSRAVTRKLRAERVQSIIVPGSIPLEEIQAQDPLGLILAGSPGGDVPAGLDSRLFALGIPVLALGGAAALMLTALGGSVGEAELRGAMASLICQPSPLTEGIETAERLLPCARDFRLPDQVVPLCQAQEIIVGFRHESLPFYGLQFEVEPVDPEGSLMLKNFALNVCSCTAWWDDDAFVDQAIEEIRRVTDGGKAVCAMTGGLDSGVSALLAFKALGDHLKCIFVDTGLLRAQEGDAFMAYYRDQLGMDILRVNAAERFLQALEGLSEPEEKRRAIGETLQAVLNEEKGRLGHFDALIRGTSYNDIMTGASANQPVLCDSVPVIEPVRELFKEEIRRVGDYLGIPPDILSRQPFPGSGLALRIMGQVTPQRLQILREADAIFRSELQRSGAVKRLWQYFAVLSPMPGEDGMVVCLRAVHASERTQACAARLPYDLVENVVDRILRSQPEVRRVVYDLTPSSNYAGIEWQ